MKHKSSCSRAASRGGWQLRAGLVGLGALLGAPIHAQTNFQPRLNLTGTWLDNVSLASEGESKQEDYIGQVTPGFRLEREGQRVNAFLDYEVQALFYESESDHNEVYHLGNLGLEIEAIPEWFYVDVGGRQAQSVVDPRAPANRNNLFATGNLVDTTSGTVTPALRHRFGDMEMSAEYTRGFVDYGDPNEDGVNGAPINDLTAQDSDNEDGRFVLRSAEPEALLTWSTGYRYEHVDYDEAQTFEYERAEAELGLKVARAWRLIGRGGVETDPFAEAGEGGLDESFWEAGFAWGGGTRNEFRALVGERFFGTSYEVLLRLAGRVLSVELGYDEEPTTETQRFAMAQRLLPSDPEPLPNPIFGRVEPQIYLLRRTHGLIALQGRYTEISLSLVSEEREYVQLAGVEDRFRTGQLSLSRQFGPRTTGEIGASVTTGRLREGGEYDDRSYQLSLSRAVSPRVSVVFAGNRTERSGELQEYDANWVSLGLQMIF